MSGKSARRARKRARADVIRGLRRLPDPPPNIDVNVAARHCWRCRFRFRVSGWMMRGIVKHNAEATAYIADVASEWRR